MGQAAVVLLEQARAKRDMAARARRLADSVLRSDTVTDLRQFALELDAIAADLERQAQQVTALAARSADLVERSANLRERVDQMGRILLVEDDLNIRTLLEHVLVSNGYEVMAVETVKNGREQLDATPYDLLIADGRLPDGTGFELADVADNRGVPTLLITGLALQLPKSELLKRDYLLKPVRAPELLEAVRRKLPRPEGEGDVVPFPKSS